MSNKAELEEVGLDEPEVQETEAQSETKKKQAKKKEKKVKITLPRDAKKGDLFVAVNGETILIKRGVEVEIEEKFIEAIRNSEAAEQLAYDKREEMKSI